MEGSKLEIVSNQIKIHEIHVSAVCLSVVQKLRLYLWFGCQKQKQKLYIHFNAKPAIESEFSICVTIAHTSNCLNTVKRKSLNQKPKRRRQKPKKTCCYCDKVACNL